MVKFCSKGLQHHNLISLVTQPIVQSYFQVFLGNTGAQDIEGNELPRLVYVSREKRPGYQHHKKAGAENALVQVFYQIRLVTLYISVYLVQLTPYH